MSTPLIIAKRRHSASEARSTPQLNASSCVNEPHKVNNFSFSPSTCLELVDKLTDNQIDHEFKRIEHLFTGRKTKKAKRDYLRAACSDSATEFTTRWETELKNVNTLLSQLNERLRTVENLSYKFDKIDDFTSNLCNLQPTSEYLVKSDKNDTSVIYSDPRLSSAIQDPPSSLLNPLTVCEQNVNVINLSDVLPERAFKRGFNIEECYFGKVSFKNGSISHRPSSYPDVLPQGFADIIEVCKCIDPNFDIDNYSCVITRCRKGAVGLPHLSDINHSNIEDGSSVITIALGANIKMECLNNTGPLQPQTFSLQAGNVFTMTKESLEQWARTYGEDADNADDGSQMVTITFLNMSQAQNSKEKVPKFGLPGQATNAKKDILMRKNTSSMNYKRRTLLLTDSVLSKTHERSLQNFSRNEFCIKKTMYNLSDIDGFEPEFQYTNTVVIAAGINDLSRQYHTPEQVCDLLLPRLKRYSRMYPNTMFIVCTVLRVAKRNSGVNQYVDALNNYVRNFALKYENIRIFNSHQLMCSYRGPSYDSFDRNGVHLRLGAVRYISNQLRVFISENSVG